jgi:hypothetical protein
MPTFMVEEEPSYWRIFKGKHEDKFWKSLRRNYFG